jgi:hypothetical protein
MITLQQWMETVDYCITEGYNYLWDCYGPNAYSLDSWDGEQDGRSFSIYLDTKTQEVYEVQAHDFKHNRAYRMINPQYKAAHDLEAAGRDVAADRAWEEVSFVDLDTDEDWLDKARAIFNYEEYDTRVDLPLTLDDSQLFELMKLAHEHDLSLNLFVEKILQDEINRINQSGTD